MNCLRLSYMLLFVSMLVPTVAAADSAVLTIEGTVLPGTCVLAAPAIALAPIRGDQLQPGDNGLKGGALNLSACAGVASATLSFDGIAADNDALRWKNTASSGAASGLSIALLSGTSGSTYLKKGDSIDVAISGNAGSQPVRVGYYLPAGGAFSAGAVKAEITVTAAYQ